MILDAIHEIDTALCPFGKPETIYCVGSMYSDLEIDVEDTAAIALTYSHRVVSIHLDSVQRPAERWLEIIGTAGRIEGDLFARSLRYFDGPRESGFRLMWLQRLMTPINRKCDIPLTALQEERRR